MFDHILSSEQISFLNGCVRRWKAELRAGICFSPPSPTPPKDSQGHLPILGTSGGLEVAQ